MLCIDIHTETQNVLFPRNTVGVAEMPRMVLPAPSSVLARRIRDATEKRRDIFLSGPAMGREFLPALFSHLRQGSRAALDESSALSIFGTLEEANDAGVEILPACPDGYAELLMGDADITFWKVLCRMLGMPDPALTLVAVPEEGERGEDSDPLASGLCSGSMWLWKKILHKYAETGAPPASFLLSEVPDQLTRLQAAQKSTGGFVTNSRIAALLGLLSREEVFARSYRQGVTLLYTGRQHISAFLVWRGNVFGMYEHHVPNEGYTDGFVERTLHDLKEFRLGWLPDEAVRQAGGHGTAFAAIPPEAEGFPVTFVAGTGKENFAGQARVPEYADTIFTGCLGLAFAASKPDESE